jgi:hypothetical protein
MKVRDLTKKKNEYKGHEIQAGKGGKNCPCLPCFDVHDFGWRGQMGQWVSFWDCATRARSGCPENLPRPHHIFRLTKRFQNRERGSVFKCLRCGQKVVIGEGGFDFHAI